jgi:hypothetical protein
MQTREVDKEKAVIKPARMMVFVFCDDSVVKLAEISAKNLGPSLIPDPTEKSAAEFKFEARHLSM